MNFYTLNKFVYNGWSKLFHLCKFHKSLIKHLHIDSLLLKFNENFDRLFFSTANVDKTMKVGAAVTTCRRGGNTASYDVLNKYFSISSMPIATSQYWNMVYGGQAEEVLQDKEGLQTMRTLGRNIAFMAKSIALGKEQFGLPEKEQITFTNFHH